MLVKDEKLLRQVSAPVESYQEGMEIGEQLIREVQLLGGIAKASGLSAPQIGILKRVFIAWGPTGTSGERAWNVYINPEYVGNASDARLFFKEGCLSFPASTVRTNRNCEIIVTQLESNDEHHKYVLHGDDAIVFQHEFDHLNGVLMFDRVAKSVPKEDNAGKDKVGRNDLCPCGSGRKYKRCCGK